MDETQGRPIESATAGQRRCRTAREPYLVLRPGSRSGAAVFLTLVVVACLLAGCSKTGQAPQEPIPESLDVVLPSSPESLSPQLAAYLPPFIEAVQKDPGNYETHGELGLVYEANQMLDEARACFENAIRLAPNEPLPRLHVAMIKKAQGDHEGGLNDLRELMQRFPDFAAGIHKYGVESLENGDIDSAEKAFARFIELLPDRSQGYIAMGDVKLRRKDYTAAVENLEHGLQINPNDGTARYLLAQAYRGLGRREDAERQLAQTQGAGVLMFIDDWTKHLPAHAKSLSRQMRRGLAMLQYKHYDKAEEIFQEMLEWYPNQIEVHNNLAVTYGRQGELDLAIETLRRAELIDSTHQETLSNLALYLHQNGQDEEALDYANRVVALAPNNTRFLRQQGSYLGRLGRYEEALVPLRKAVELEPQNAINLRVLGDGYLSLERWSDACEQYRQAAEIEPDHLWTQVAVADACLKAGARDEARAAYDRAQAIDPDDATVVALADRF